MRVLLQEKVGMNPLWWLLASDPERVPEPDLEIMRMLLECIVLLCQRRGLREELRKRKVKNELCVLAYLDCVFIHPHLR